MLFGSRLCTSFKIHKFGQTFCIFYSLFLIRGHKEFTCWSCTLWMYRPFRCLLLHQMVLPVLIQHNSVETECTSSWGLVVLFSFLPLVYYLSCILVCTIHFNSLPAFLFFYFFILFTFLLWSFLFTLLFHQFCLCHLHVFSSISLPWSFLLTSLSSFQCQAVPFPLCLAI